MKKFVPFILVPVVFILSFIFIQGCEKGKEPSKRFKIAGIIFQEDQSFRRCLLGMKDAAKKEGVTLFEANSDNKPDKEIQLVNTYITRKVDAIIISPLSKKASITALKRTYDSGIKVITYNTTIEGDIPSTHVGSDEVDLGIKTGKAARKYIQNKLYGKAKIAILAFKSQVPEQSEARTGGFKKELSDLEGVEIVSEQDAWLPEMAVNKMRDILTAHPDLDLIFTANEGGTVGAVMAVKNAGKAGKIPVFGIDVSTQILDFLLSENNILQASTCQQSYNMGFQAMESAVKLLGGGKVKRRVLLPGVLLRREKPDSVRAYKKRLEELALRG